MKFTKYFMPFAALALLASCSNDNVIEPNVDDTPQEEVKGTYLSFNVAMATGQNGTRDDSFKGYDDGAEGEYAINNVWLYLYRVAKGTPAGTGDTENDATLYYIKQVGTSSFTPDEDDKDKTAGLEKDAVTGNILATFQLTNMTKADKDNYNYYAYIIVNKPTVVTSDPALTTSKLSDLLDETNTWAASGHAVASISNNKTVTFKSATAYNDMIPQYGDNTSTFYFTMTNAPLVDEDGNVTYLAALDEDNFATSPAQAKTAAADVYVQRGVAKVSIDVDDNEFTPGHIEGMDQEEVGANAVVSIQGWSLDIINKVTYPIQHVGTSDDFTSGNWKSDWFKSAGIHSGDYSHIFWSIDPNYNKKYDSEEAEGYNGNFLTDVNVGSTFNGTSDVEYCLENTMDAKFMQKLQSTRIIFKASYMIDGSTAESFIVYPGTDKAYTVAGMLQEGEITAGPHPIEDIIKDEGDNIKNVLEAVGAASKTEVVDYYPGGTTYYTAIIRHFSDDEKEGVPETGVTNLDQYDPAKHLGRYGVVRNNTYVASISSVYGFGSPTVPTPDDPTPDDYPDPIKYNIMLDVKVLAWAMRSHGYNLK